MKIVYLTLASIFLIGCSGLSQSIGKTQKNEQNQQKEVHKRIDPIDIRNIPQEPQKQQVIDFK